MKVLDLRCPAGHGFEGWFASEAEYERQRGTGAIECPQCGAADIARLPSAPRLNLSGASRPPETVSSPSSPSPSSAPAPAGTPRSPVQEIAAHWRQAVESLMRQTEDVGDRFPEEARRIHYGEVAPKGIRGQATPQERAELQEEGIETMAIPVPAALKRTLQ